MTRILPAKHRDLQFKDLYSDPALAAFLATMLVPEYRGKEPPPPQLVRKVDTELRVPGDGFVRADLLWRMPFPDLEHFFYFNIDAQNEYRPGYPIGHRIDYQASMILVNEPRNGRRSEDYYASLEPVYGAWLFQHPPKALELTMTRYTKAEVHHVLTRTDTLEPDPERRLYPYRICLNGTSEVDWSRIAVDEPIRPFGILGDPFLDSEETARFMRRDYGIILSDYTKEVKLAMNNWYEATEHALIDKGISIGRDEGFSIGWDKGRSERTAEIVAELRSKGVDEAIIRDIERTPRK